MNLPLPPCDYFVVAAHGCGQVSFAYYLYRMGIPCTRFQDLVLDDNLDTAFALTTDFKKRYSLCGITVDHKITTTASLEKLSRYRVPVLWQVRDPIDMLRSLVNIRILSNSIYQMRGAPLPYSKDIKKLIEDHLYSEDKSRYLNFSGQISSITNPSSIKLVDVREINDLSCQTTMQNIAAFLGGGNPSAIENISSIAFNDMKSNYFLCRNAKLIPIVIDNITFNMTFYPKHISEYINYYLRNDHIRIFSSIEHENRAYDIVCHQTDVSEQLIQELRKNPSIITALENLFLPEIRKEERMLQNIQRIYDRKKLSTEETIALIRENQRWLQTFTERMHEDYTAVERVSPGHTQNWTYTNFLLNGKRP